MSSYPLVHSINKYLLRTHNVLGIFLGSEESMIKKEIRSLPLGSLCSNGERRKSASTEICVTDVLKEQALEGTIIK